MGYLDDWHDWVRVLSFAMNFYALFLLALRYFEGRTGYNKKTVDLWYALVMWSFAGIVFNIQGIYLDRPFSAAFVFSTAASLVGAKGLHAKGPWGGHDS